MLNFALRTATGILLKGYGIMADTSMGGHPGDEARPRAQIHCGGAGIGIQHIAASNNHVISPQKCAQPCTIVQQ